MSIFRVFQVRVAVGVALTLAMLLLVVGSTWIVVQLRAWGGVAEWQGHRRTP